MSVESTFFILECELATRSPTAIPIAKTYFASRVVVIGIAPFANREQIEPQVQETQNWNRTERMLSRTMCSSLSRNFRFRLYLCAKPYPGQLRAAALSQHVRKLRATLKRSLTWDRGLEMAKHQDFTVATDVQVYFCDPQSPWQRGTNENTNLLLRQYFPRGTDLSGYSQAQLDQVSLRLNQRPRKTLGFQTPASKLHASVASTV